MLQCLDTLGQVFIVEFLVEVMRVNFDESFGADDVKPGAFLNLPNEVLKKKIMEFLRFVGNLTRSTAVRLVMSC